VVVPEPLPSVRTARSQAQIAAAAAEIAVTVQDSSGQAITVPAAVKRYKNGTLEVGHFLRKKQKARQSLNQSRKIWWALVDDLRTIEDSTWASGGLVERRMAGLATAIVFDGF